MDPGVLQPSGGAEVRQLAQSGLIEREPELAQIDSLLDTLGSPSPSLLVLEGETGIGKTELLLCAAERARERELRVFSARGSELEQDFPFGVIRQWLEPPLRSCSTDERQRLLGGAAGLATPVFEPTIHSAHAGSLGSILHGLYWLVVNLAAGRDLLLSVDDAQWADRGSLQFLNFLAARLAGSPIGLLIATRPPSVEENEILLARLTSDPAARVTHLVGLSEHGTGLVLAAATKRFPEPDFIRAARAATGGNPFYLRELCRALVEQAISPTNESADQIAAIRPRELSRSILARLSTDARSLLQALAILDAPADSSLAGALAGLAPEATRTAADELGQAGLITDQPQLALTHSIVRGAVLGSIPATQRTRLEAKAADLLAERGESAERLAMHLVATEPAASASTVAVLCQAGQSAVARGMPDVAASFLRRAMLEPPAKGLRPALLRELGQVLLLSRAPDAETHLRRALESSEDPLARAEIAWGLADLVLNAGRTDEAIELMRLALRENAERDLPFAYRIEALLAALTALDVSTADGVYSGLPRLQQRAEAGGSDARWLQLVVALLLALSKGSRDEVVSLVMRGLDEGRFIAEETGEPLVLVYALDALIFTDELERAESVANEILDDAARRGSIIAFVVGLAHRGLVELRTGRLDDAEADLRRALDLAREHQLALAIPFTASYLAATLRERGELGESARLIEGVRLSGLENSTSQAVLLDTRGRVRRAVGDRQGAAADLRGAHERYAALHTRNPVCARTRSELALAIAETDRERAEALIAWELVDAQAARQPRGVGVALRAQAALRDGPEAIELLRESAETLQSSPGRLEQAHSLVALGAALRRARYRSECRGPLREGMNLAERSHANSLVEYARGELAATGVRVRRASFTGPDALTPSERRIAQMAAEGASNPEIAQGLFLTIKTVEMHLTNAYRKLGIGGRRELAAVLGAQDA